MTFGRFFLLPLVSLLLLLSGCAAAGELTLVYSGNFDGELEPCGCSEGGDLGGVRRRATKIAELRDQDKNLVVISAGGLMASQASKDRFRSEYIVRGLSTLDYDAIGVQWSDLSFGEELMYVAPLPWVSSNGQGKHWLPQKLIRRPGIELAFFSWLDPARDPARQMQGGKPRSSENVAALQQALAEARKAGRLTVVATTLTLAQAKSGLPLELIDILTVKANYEEYLEPVQEGNTVVLTPGSRGMRLGRLGLSIANGRISDFRHEVIPLPKDVADATQLADWYAQFNDKVKQDYLQRSAARRAMRSGASPYAGAEACAACHQQAYKVWSGSEHHKAFEDLEKVGKNFDPKCIACHVVAFELDGGFIDMKMSDHLAGVQCENCHGAGQAHVDAGGKAPLGNKDWKPEQMCAQCHIGSHSPDFDFGSYWPKILHHK